MKYKLFLTIFLCFIFVLFKNYDKKQFFFLGDGAVWKNILILVGRLILPGGFL
jgi:hypothetical protein